MSESANLPEGGCACRAVRYRLRAEPLIVHAGPCTECRRLTGAAFAANALIERPQIAMLDRRERLSSV